MQIHPTSTFQNNTPAFESRFVRNQTLRKAFKESYDTFTTKDEDQLNRQFLNAVKGLLNDGKDDVIKLSENGSETFIYVNGKRVGAQNSFINWNKSAEGTKNAIITLAEQERGIKKVYRYESLSKDEIAATQDILDSYKQLNPRQKGFMFEIGQLPHKLEYRIIDYVKDELGRLEKEIFSRKN